MLTTRWTPLLPASFDSVRREMQEALNQYDGRRAHVAAYVPLTIWEDEGHVYLQADLPGFSKEALDIRYQDGQLWISGERPVPKDDGKYWHNERLFGEFSRAVSLPDVIDPDAIEAELEDGVLFITMHKKPEAQPHKITVKCVGGNGKTKRARLEKPKS